MKIIYHYSVLIIVLIYSSTTFGQNTESKWKIGVSVSPDFCYRWQPDVQTSIFEMVLQNKLTSKLGYHGGIDVIYNLTNQLSLQGTVRYSNMGVRTKTASCEEPYDSSSMCSIYYNFDFIQVPIGVNYSLGEGKLRFIAGAYVAPAFLMGTRRIAKINPISGDRYKDNEGTVPSNYTISLFCGVRAGLSWQCTEKISLVFQPEYSFGIQNDFYSSHLWSAGVAVGCYYSL